MWRNFDDIEDSWKSVLSIIDFYAKNQYVFAKYHGPGSWFDPDMLIIGMLTRHKAKNFDLITENVAGNFGLSDDQSRAQMSIWSILAAPLLMSNDLRKMTQTQKNILLNRDVIAIDQDELGILGKKVQEKNKVEVWLKPVTPKVGGLFSFAVVYFNRNTMGSTVQVSYSPQT